MEVLRTALVGFGFIAEKGHWPAYRAAAEAANGTNGADGARARGRAPFEVVAVVDPCPARRAKAKELVPSARVYADHLGMLAAEGRDLDCVHIATPPCDHAVIARAALDHGLHVLCEKPLTVSRGQAASLLAHAARVKRVVFPSHNYKHAPVVKAVRRALDEGLVGEVRQVTMQTFRPTHARGTPEWRPDWRRERAIAGGGIAMDHGSHTFYLAFDWMGSYPESITASIARSDTYDTEDSLSCTLAFPNGRRATAHLTWTAGMRRVLYTIHGTKGAIRVEDDEVEIVRMHEDGEGPLRWTSERETIASDWMDASHTKWFGSVLERFAAAIAAGEYVGREAEDALRCVELIGAAYRSAEQGSREIPLGLGGLLPFSKPRRNLELVHSSRGKR